jgi:hypothetical protein
VFLSIITGCNTEYLYQNSPIPISSSQTTRIDFSSTPGTEGKVEQLEALGNMAMRWKGDGILTWKIDVPAAEAYQVSISYASLGSGEDANLGSGAEATFDTVKEELVATLPKSISIFADNLELGSLGLINMNNEYLINYDRYTFTETVMLEQGVQEIRLEMSGLRLREVVDFRALELTPTSIISQLEEETQEAEALRSNGEWMADALYGVMLHWTDLTINEDGSQLDYKEAVDSFDVQALADLTEEIGAGYLLFTLNHQYPHCPAPIEEWERIHPGWTTERDLIQEIADELDSRGIPLMLYVASHLVGNPDKVDEEDWLKAHQFGEESELKGGEYFDIFANNKIVLTAIGERYGNKVKGFWLDGWDLIPETYPHFDYRELFTAAKVGNPDRIVTFNRWIFPTVTPWQDYWAGEIDSPDEFPNSQYMDTEVGKGLLYHSLIALEDDWVYTAEGYAEGESFYKPRFDSEEIIEYVQGLHEIGAPVTINIAIHQDGTLGDEALKIMKEVKSALR